ncbi:MAG: DNA-3-methyladenine glycosylase [Pirellulaceae bacterium]|nr:DNA-3-methyladenine glycosylase [Pirellulaceae bacterium]
MLQPPPRKNCLSRTFYDRPPSAVARDLLGKALLHKVDDAWIGGLIVETEAYLASDDPASHSARGKTPSNASMFDSPGTLYVYPIHAKYCLNMVTETKGRGSAVLIRAIEPVWGVDQMRIHRGYNSIKRLTRGPAMLCQALAVDRSHDGTHLLSSRDFRVADVAGDCESEVHVTPRIGVSRAQDRLLRFICAGNPFLSR